VNRFPRPAFLEREAMKKEKSQVEEDVPGSEGPPDPEGPDGPAADADPDPGDGESDVLRRELQALNDRHLRLAAEFDNFRKRSQAELGSSGTRAQAALIAELLDVLDDFHRVTSVDPGAATVETVLDGVGMVERKLHRILKDAGLEALEPEGEAFDPNVMEAMARVPADSREEDDTVDEVLQTGFRFKGQLVRPARVSVRKVD